MPDKTGIIALTKNNLAAVPDYLKDENIFDYLISADGAEIRSLKEGDLLYSNYLSADTTQILRRVLNKTKVVLEVQVNGRIYVERKSYRKINNKQMTRGRSWKGVEPVYGVIHLLELFSDRIEMVKITSQSESRLMELGLLLEDSLSDDQGDIIRGRNHIEIRPEGNSKFTALEIMQKKLNIDKQDIVFIPSRS